MALDADLAGRLEKLASLVRSRQADVADAIEKLEAQAVGLPDPLTMPPETRNVYISTIAAGLEISVSELMTLYHVARTLAHDDD